MVKFLWINDEIIFIDMFLLKFQQYREFYKRINQIFDHFYRTFQAHFMWSLKSLDVFQFHPDLTFFNQVKNLKFNFSSFLNRFVWPLRRLFFKESLDSKFCHLFFWSTKRPFLKWHLLCDAKFCYLSGHIFFDVDSKWWMLSDG